LTALSVTSEKSTGTKIDLIYFLAHKPLSNLPQEKVDKVRPL
jgi:hypothetical protein